MKRQPDLDLLTRNHRTSHVNTTLGGIRAINEKRNLARRTTSKERRQFEEMDDMTKWSAARLKPNSYDFKVEVFNLEYEILNVDPDEYSYICFIKDVKRCVASKNEVVEMNPYEKFKVLLEARYIVEVDDNMEFIFEQYKSFGKRVTRVYVEAIPVDFVEPRTLLEAQPEDNEGFVRQDNEEVEEGIPDEFYWSVESDESDHEEDHESGQDGQGSGVVEGIETGQESGVVKGIEIGQGSGGVEDIEVQGEMFEYHEDSSYEGSTDDEDAVTRFSKHMKGQQFAYGDNEKIHFKVGQVFEGVDHFRKVFRDYVIQREFSVRKIHNERRRFKAKCSMYNVKSVSPEGIPNFQRCFLGFATKKKGFIEGCRHFIGVDGCHLKGPYGGVLLSAVSMDANSGIFPVAITICEIENKESWRYFMTLLKEFIGDIDPITIMSDRQKGLVDAIQTCWPNASVRHCARHVYANFRKKFPRKINGLIEPARNVEAIWPGSDEFEVVDSNCLSSRLRCLLFKNIRNMEDYMDSSLRITSYVKTYADHIHPIFDPLSWPDLLEGRQLNPPIKHSKRRSFISPNKSDMSTLKQLSRVAGT
ncbi:hypothetical protein Pint_21536 [Pistacia integerrima]|uniref:Uncharacterized protein n=1 Tax=Pistacia integerrima TaxID=434235 RepID=A0ACC0XD71_9ROSI|nr:hypothetical protein Pint_21536 [Pistacia integerrima]